MDAHRQLDAGVFETALRDVPPALAELQAVAFSSGPGAFTGLRTACAVAQLAAVKVRCADDSVTPASAVTCTITDVTGRVALILPCLGRTERDVQAGGEQFVQEAQQDEQAACGHGEHIMARRRQGEEEALLEVLLQHGGREPLLDAIDEDGHEGDALAFDLDAEVQGEAIAPGGLAL